MNSDVVAEYLCCRAITCVFRCDFRCGCTQVQRLVCHVLSDLGKDDADALLAAGMLDVLYESLTINADNPLIVVRSRSCLSHCMVTWSWWLLTTMCCPLVQEYNAYALWIQAEVGHKVRDELIATGCHQRLFAALRRHIGSATALVVLLGALGNLCYLPSCQSVAIADGWVPVVFSAIDAHPECVSIARHGCRLVRQPCFALYGSLSPMQ